MLIEEHALEVFTPPCSPGTERFSAVARLAADIRAVLPYLNGTLQGALYDATVPSLRWQYGGHVVMFQPNQIAIGSVADRAEAVHAVAELVALVNRTWERRAEIEPNHQTRARPTPLAVYRLLPGGNCRACGEPTCFTFALKLTAAQARPDACPPLGLPAHADRLAELRALLGG